MITVFGSIQFDLVPGSIVRFSVTAKTAFTNFYRSGEIKKALATFFNRSFLCLEVAVCLEFSDNFQFVIVSLVRGMQRIDCCLFETIVGKFFDELVPYAAM